MVRAEKMNRNHDMRRVLLFGVVGWMILNHVLFAFAFLPFGEIEGDMNPVTSRITITSTTSVDGGVVISAEADKHRDCLKWVRTDWYYGDRGSDAIVPMSTARHLDKPQIRPSGTLRWDEIFIPVDDLEHTHANAVHKCHFLWNTVTPYWR
jgi:hypothetical protein